MAATRTIVSYSNLPNACRRLGNARIADRVFGCQQKKHCPGGDPVRDNPAGSEAPAGALPAAVPARRRLSFAFGGTSPGAAS